MKRPSTICVFMGEIILVVLVALVIACGGSTTRSGGTSPTGPASPSPTVIIHPSRDTLRAIADTDRLKAVVINDAGDTVKDASIQWNSADSNVVTVNSNGAITAGNRIDSVTITAAASGGVGKATIVVEIPVDSLTLTPGTVVGTVPDYPLLFSVGVYDSAGRAVQGGVLDWRVGDTTVARTPISRGESRSVYVTPVSQGTTDLVVMVDSARARATIKVSAVDDSTIDGFLVDIYRHEFGLDLTNPVWAFTVNPVFGDYWVSAAYVRDSLYHVFVAASDSFGDAGGDIRGVGTWQDSVFHGKVWLAKQSLIAFGEPAPQGGEVYRPSGTDRIVTILFDHGDTNVAAMTDSLWPAIQDSVSTAYREASTTAWSAGQPLIDLKFLRNITMNVDSLGCYATGTTTSCLEDLVRDSTGLEPQGNYDVLAVVDLNPEKPAGGTELTSGIAFITIHWIFDKTSYGSIDATKARMLAFALYSHELGHSLGWQHVWPESSACSTTTVCLGPITPARFYGWTDTDGDGIPEILDPTPYGLHQ